MLPVPRLVRPCRRSIRCLSSSKKPFSLPPPTWSVEEILPRQTASISSETQLDALCQHACLEPRDELRQSVGEMMTFMQQVQEYTPKIEIDEEQQQQQQAPPYARRCPVHSWTSTQIDEQMNESQVIFDSLLKPKTTPVGAYRYFQIQTK